MGYLPVRQHGQALIYGLFTLATGLVALFFLFNTGQLASEKTKLVNTADAVAYSAGIMHARALNFSAYTNRALIANEVLIAQTVSISSWVEYAQGHVRGVPPLNCYQIIYSIPFWLGLAEYVPLCFALSWQPGAAMVNFAEKAVSVVAPMVVAASELAKSNLQISQATMFIALVPARTQVMKQVAQANYRGDGSVEVDGDPVNGIALTDDFLSFITRYSGSERTRFREVEVAAANLDRFVPERSWYSYTPNIVNGCVPARGSAEKWGSTELVGFDDWRAKDKASLEFEVMGWLGCEGTGYSLGDAERSARDWSYSGVPNYLELSKKALAYTPSGGEYGPTLKFAVRLTRAKSQARTSAGRSQIKPGGKLDIFQGSEAGGVMAAVATSEVFFHRQAPRPDNKTELGSLFNPFWQVHLIANSNADIAAAMAKQGAIE